MRLYGASAAAAGNGPEEPSHLNSSFGVSVCFHIRLVNLSKGLLCLVTKDTSTHPSLWFAFCIPTGQDHLLLWYDRRGNSNVVTWTCTSSRTQRRTCHTYVCSAGLRWPIQESKAVTMGPHQIGYSHRTRKVRQHGIKIFHHPLQKSPTPGKRSI